MQDSFGDKLRVARVKKKLTQQQLADLIGVSRIIVSHWENGSSHPRYNKLLKLAEVLDERNLI